VTTKFVQIKVLGTKLGFCFSLYVYSKNFKKNLLTARAKIFIMKHLQMGVYQVCSNKSSWVKIGPAPGAYIQVSDFRAIMALLF
jgi:hypothetical protein